MKIGDWYIDIKKTLQILHVTLSTFYWNPSTQNTCETASLMTLTYNLLTRSPHYSREVLYFTVVLYSVARRISEDLSFRPTVVLSFFIHSVANLRSARPHSGRPSAVHWRFGTYRIRNHYSLIQRQLAHPPQFYQRGGGRQKCEIWPRFFDIIRL